VSEQEKSFTDLGKKALSRSENGKRIIISEQVDKLQGRGFTAEEAFDILASNDFDNLFLIESVIDEKFNRTSSTSFKNVKEAFVCPSSYNEIKSNVEDQLKKLGPNNFINKLSRSESPIMPINDKAYNSYLRIASAAYKNESLMPALHTELKKWFEEAMYVSVCAAKSSKNEIRVASVNNNFIASSGSKEFDVNLENGSCTCVKFAKSHYGDFGLACEHIVAASNKVSPHQRLLKAVKEASNNEQFEDENQLFTFDLRTVMRS
jgi:hypothetical protein